MSDADLDVLQRAVVAARLGYIIGAEREYVAHRAAVVRAWRGKTPAVSSS